MPLTSYQASYNGFVFGAGTPFQIIDLDGFAGTPDLRVQDAPRGYNDGYFTGRDFYNGRNIVFTLNIFAGNGNTAQQNWFLLQQALKPVQQLTSSNGVLLINLPPGTGAVDPTYKLSARVRSRKAKVDAEFSYGFIRAQVELFAPDYRYYQITATSSSTLTPLLSNGRIYNRTYNLVYTQALASGASATNSLAINNTGGTAATGPLITINGPIIYPQITNLTTGAYVNIASTLSSADTLVIDMTNNTVTLNGGNARNLMTGGSQFFTVPAGSSETLLFSALSSSGTGVISYSPAYV